jgi:hypothetical protein
LRSRTMFAAGFHLRLGAAWVQCRHRSDASNFQIGVSGRLRTSLTAVRSMSECVAQRLHFTSRKGNPPDTASAIVGGWLSWAAVTDHPEIPRFAHLRMGFTDLLGAQLRE